MGLFFMKEELVLFEGGRLFERGAYSLFFSIGWALNQSIMVSVFHVCMQLLTLSINTHAQDKRTPKVFGKKALRKFGYRNHENLGKFQFRTKKDLPHRGDAKVRDGRGWVGMMCHKLL